HEVIETDDVFSLRQQPLAEVRADKTRSAGDQRRHSLSPLASVAFRHRDERRAASPSSSCRRHRPRLGNSAPPRPQDPAVAASGNCLLPKQEAWCCRLPRIGTPPYLTPGWPKIVDVL